MTHGALWHFSETYVEACRTARLRRWPERLGREALHLERGDFYGWRDTPPRAGTVVRVALIGDPRTVLISDNRMWWVPRLDQLAERLEGAVCRQEPAALPLVRESVARRIAERIRERARSWEEVALELLLEHEATSR